MGKDGQDLTENQSLSVVNLSKYSLPRKSFYTDIVLKRSNK